MANQNDKFIVEAFLTPHEAVTSFLTPLDPKYIFGKEAIEEMLREYRSGFHLFSFTNADLFIGNLYYNLRVLLNIDDEDERVRVNCNENTITSVNNYLKELKIEYHFEMVGFGTGADYLRCEKDYANDK